MNTDNAGATRRIYAAVFIVSLLSPFFFAGWCVCRIFSLVSGDVPRLYGVDLCGAALGTLLLFPLLQPLGPERMLWYSSVAALAAAVALAPSKRAGLRIAAVGL